MTSPFEYRFKNVPPAPNAPPLLPHHARFLALKKRGGSFNGVKVEK